MKRTLDDHFIDWYSYVLGHGYGTGEQYTLPAIKKFLELCNEGSRNNQYNYEILEKELTPTVAWLLINLLIGCDTIEYGTSPRYAWLTDQGEALKTYMSSKTNDELYEIAMSPESDSTICFPDTCNCGERGYSEKKLCHNPFWIERPRK